MDVAGCSLAELIDDPLIGLIMRSDGVDRRELELLLERASRTAIAGARFSETPVDHPDNDRHRTPDQSRDRDRGAEVNRGRQSLEK